MERLSAPQRLLLRQWSPAFIAAGVSWLLLLIVGATPFARASGLGLAILGVTASMRPMGFVASIAGGLTLALCPLLLVTNRRQRVAAGDYCHRHHRRAGGDAVGIDHAPTPRLRHRNWCPGLPAHLLEPDRHRSKFAPYRPGDGLAALFAGRYDSVDQPEARHQTGDSAQAGAHPWLASFSSLSARLTIRW